MASATSASTTYIRARNVLRGAKTCKGVRGMAASSRLGACPSQWRDGHSRYRQPERLYRARRGTSVEGSLWFAPVRDERRNRAYPRNEGVIARCPARSAGQFPPPGDSTAFPPIEGRELGMRPGERLRESTDGGARSRVSLRLRERLPCLRREPEAQSYQPRAEAAAGCELPRTVHRRMQLCRPIRVELPLCLERRYRRHFRSFPSPAMFLEREHLVHKYLDIEKLQGKIQQEDG